MLQRMRNHAPGVLCGLFVMGSAVIGGCGSGSGGGDAGGGDTTRLVGFWSLTRTSGGLPGNGYPVTAGSELLTFSGNGTYARTVNGQTTSGTFEVTNRTTLLYGSSQKYPVITYKDANGGSAALAEIVSEVDSQHLIVNEEAADGFTREYERTVQTN